jgi:hypothetical protein
MEALHDLIEKWLLVKARNCSPLWPLSAEKLNKAIINQYLSAEIVHEQQQLQYAHFSNLIFPSVPWWTRQLILRHPRGAAHMFLHVTLWYLSSPALGLIKSALQSPVGGKGWLDMQKSWAPSENGTRVEKKLDLTKDAQLDTLSRKIDKRKKWCTAIQLRYAVFWCAVAQRKFCDSAEQVPLVKSLSLLMHAAV